MKKNLDAFHGSILLKANNSVNRSAKPDGCLSDCGFSAAAHAFRDNSVMGVKDYVHFCLPL
jgi:hypothetical protein